MTARASYRQQTRPGLDGYTPLGVRFNGMDAAWPDNAPVSGLAAVGTTTIASSFAGKIARSTDGGATWSQVQWFYQNVDRVNNNSLLLVANGFLIYPSPNNMFWSSDGGVNWVRSTGYMSVFSGYSVDGFAWNGSVYLLAGGVNKFATSTDLNTWTSRDTAVTNAFGTTTSGHHVVAIGSRLIIYAPQFTTAAVQSDDNGSTWTANTALSSAGWGTYRVRASHYNGSRLILVGQSGRCAYSDNQGASYTIPSGFSASVANNDCFGIAFSGSIYVVCASGGRITTSPDGITWTTRTGLSSTSWGASNPTGVVWNGSAFCVSGPNGLLATSPDGINWTVRTGFATSNIWGAAGGFSGVWNGSQYIAAGATGRVATSPDGVNWTARPQILSTTFGTNSVLDLLWDGSKYVAVGMNGASATSSDGATWTYQPSLAAIFGANSINRIARSPSVYVAAGAGGRVATSSDGITWTDRTTNLTSTSFLTANVSGLVWTGSVFVVVGSNRCATSPDGVTWTFQSDFGTKVGGSYLANGMAFGLGTIVVCGGGSSATPAYSFDNGVTWTTATSPFPFTNWTSIAFSGEMFLGGSGFGDLAYSRTGVTWIRFSAWSSNSSPSPNFWGDSVGKFIVGPDRAVVLSTGSSQLAMLSF